MPATIDISPIIIEKIDKLRQALKRPQELLEMIGDLVTKDCILAFHNQALGDIEWPERYPGMKTPFINIAGALQDFIDGRSSPKPSRFSPRPALIDEGARGGLLSNLTFRVIDGHTVRVGTIKPYAGLHQHGGVSTQTYGADVQERIQKWLFKERKKPGPRGGKYTPRKGREGYVEKLAHLIHKTSHTQNVIARPFIGITDNAASEIKMTIERFFVKAQR